MDIRKCQCGRKVKRASYYLHTKSKIHQKGIEEQWKDDNSQRVQCECSGYYTYDKQAHLKTQKHKRYIENKYVKPKLMLRFD